MYVLTFILVMILLIAVIIGIPFAISVSIYRFISKKGYDKRMRLIALIPILILCYLIYSSLYPGKKFYKHDFKEVTGIELPDFAKIKYKTASFPDHFGDYTSVSLINVGQDFYYSLPEILKERGLKEKQKQINSQELNKALKEVPDLVINKEYSLQKGGGVYYYVGFLSDKESIIVKRLSW